MNQVAFKKCVPLFVALLLIFSACTGNLGANDSSIKSEQLIPMDQLDDLTLKIYFDSPRTGCITYPTSQEQLVSYAESNDQVIVVDSAKLLQHVEMLEQLNTVTLSP